jgi:hypothetical protein
VSPQYNRFISLAGHLQRLMADMNIALPVAPVAEILGCDRHTVSTYIWIAKSTDALHEVGTWSYADHRAKEYRFPLENFDWATGKERVRPPTAPVSKEHQVPKGEVHQEDTRHQSISPSEPQSINSSVLHHITPSSPHPLISSEPQTINSSSHHSISSSVCDDAPEVLMAWCPDGVSPLDGGSRTGLELSAPPDSPRSQPWSPLVTSPPMRRDS